MAPRHLVLPPRNSFGTVRLVDFQSLDVEQIALSLASSAEASQQVLLAPSWSLDREALTKLNFYGVQLTQASRLYPHLDTDHLGESVKLYWEGQSLLQSFSFAAWSVSRTDRKISVLS